MALAVAGAATVVALGVALHGDRSTHFDRVVLKHLYADLTGRWPGALIFASDPIVSLALLALVLVTALRARYYTLAVLAVVGPLVSTGLTQYVAKPVVARPYGEHTTTAVSLAYPSGHETLVATTAAVVVLAICALPWQAAIRALLVLATAAWTVFAGIGLVINFWHYTTDVIGAIGLSLAVVLVLAIALDLSSPVVLARSRTARAA